MHHQADHPISHDSGFTLIEMLVVLVIMAVLFGVSFVNLARPQESANTATVLNTLLTDMKNQQILSMAGDDGGNTSAQPHGIYITSSQFVLFTGSSYTAGSSSNYAENLPTAVQASTTLPSTQIVFSKGSGEVQGFTAGSNTITITSANTTHTITINRFGATTVN